MNLQLQDSRLDLTVTPNLWLQYCWLERPANWQTATVLFAAAVTVCCADTPLKVGPKDFVPVIPWPNQWLRHCIVHHFFNHVMLIMPFFQWFLIFSCSSVSYLWNWTDETNFQLSSLHLKYLSPLYLFLSLVEMFL